MNVSLTPFFEKMIAKEITSGRYHSASEVVREALRMFQERKKDRERKYDQLRKDIAIGIKQADEGRTAPFDDAMVERIKREGRPAAESATEWPEMSHAQLTEEAEADLRDIWEFISPDSEEQADRWIELLRQKCTNIAERPELGRSRPDLATRLRYFPFRDYLIFYRPIPGGVEVIRILHGSRNIGAEFEE